MLLWRSAFSCKVQRHLNKKRDNIFVTINASKLFIFHKKGKLNLAWLVQNISKIIMNVFFSAKYAHWLKIWLVGNEDFQSKLIFLFSWKFDIYHQIIWKNLYHIKTLDKFRLVCKVSMMYRLWLLKYIAFYVTFWVSRFMILKFRTG